MAAFVIRYDHGDTGRSVTYEPGHPTYKGADLVTDATGGLDAYGLPAAHVPELMGVHPDGLAGLVAHVDLVLPAAELAGQ
jgi:hypothetical protein